MTMRDPLSLDPDDSFEPGAHLRPGGDVVPGRDPAPPRRPSDPPILGPVPAASTRGDEPDETSRYRRAERPAPASDGRTVPAEDPYAPTAEVSLAAPSAASTRAIAEPLAALAAAFQANAEALRRSQEMQADLGRALQRADRSEVLLQSTGALNETFKGLTNVQKTLVSRIAASEKTSREGRWFGPFLILGAMAVIGAAMWLVVRRMGEMETQVVGTGDIATQLRNAQNDGADDARRDAAAAFETQRQAMNERIDRAEAGRKAAEAERDERAAAAKTAQQELAGLQGEVSTARNEALRSRALEAELTRLRADAAVRDPEAERLRRDLETERATTADLRKRLADLATGRTTDAAAASRRDDRPPDVSVDRHDIERARRVLNELLQASAASGGEYLQFGKIGGANADRLEDVVATSYAGNGRVLTFLKARQARVIVDRTNRRVEIVFDEGSLEMNGQSMPFPGGSFRKVVADADSTSRWVTSGLVFVQAR